VNPIIESVCHLRKIMVTTRSGTYPPSTPPKKPPKEKKKRWAGERGSDEALSHRVRFSRKCANCIASHWQFPKLAARHYRSF